MKDSTEKPWARLRAPLAHSPARTSSGSSSSPSSHQRRPAPAAEESPAMAAPHLKRTVGEESPPQTPSSGHWSHHAEDPEAQREAMMMLNRRFVLKTYIYLCIFAVCWLPSTINRVLSMVDQVVFPLLMLQATFVPLSGFMNSVVYFWTGVYFKRQDRKLAMRQGLRFHQRRLGHPDDDEDDEDLEVGPQDHDDDDLRDSDDLSGTTSYVKKIDKKHAEGIMMMKKKNTIPLSSTVASKGAGAAVGGGVSGANAIMSFDSDDWNENGDDEEDEERRHRGNATKPLVGRRDDGDDGEEVQRRSSSFVVSPSWSAASTPSGGPIAAVIGRTEGSKKGTYIAFEGTTQTPSGAAGASAAAAAFRSRVAAAAGTSGPNHHRTPQQQPLGGVAADQRVKRPSASPVAATTTLRI